MNTQRPLLPKFLKKYDTYLLLHKPEIWSIRTHLVWYYSILLMAALTILVFLAPDDPRKDSLSGIWAGFVSIVSFIGLVLWLIYLLRFNVFKRYGTLKRGSRLSMFLWYFLTCGIFVIFPYIPSFVESIRANNAYADEEIVRDINTFNTGICQLEYAHLKHEWRRDTVKVSDKNETTPVVQEEIDYDSDATAAAIDTVVNGQEHVFLALTQKEINRRMLVADSTIKQNDSLYIFLTCPSYTFLRVYNSDKYTLEKELNDRTIYQKIIRNYAPPEDRHKLEQELKGLIAKYDWDKSPYTGYRADTSDYLGRIRRKYDLYDVDRSINNIVTRKYQWTPDKLNRFFRPVYYITLAITLLLFIFRHSTTRTFFLSILTALILSLLTALIMAFTGTRPISFFIWTIGYFILFFFITLLAWRARVREVVTGIAINLFVLLLPFMPLLLVGYHYAVLKDRYLYSDNRPYNEAVMFRNLYCAEWAGALLLMLLLLTYIQVLYRKWYALPEE